MKYNDFNYDICIIDYFFSKWIKNISGVDILFKDYNFIKYTNKSLGHGIAIFDIISKLCIKSNICLVPIDETFSCVDIIYILFYIVNKKLSKIVNLSFGFFIDYQDDLIVEVFRYIINLAKRKGILIVVSDSNNCVRTIPYIFNNSISVTSKNNNLFDIFYDGNFLFKKISLYVDWIDNRKIWVYGNSFYTAI